MADFNKILSCRICKNKNLKKIIDLNKIPLANNFSTKKNKSYSLAINHCKKCMHNQLSIGIDPKILFSKYLYQSSFSKSYTDHNDMLAKELKKKLKLNKNSIVYDIGSNDGILLNSFKKININAIGVEPSINLSKISNKKGLKTERKFLNFQNSKSLSKKYGYADLITANNVFAHIYNYDDFIYGIKNLLQENGIFVVEVSYFKDVVEKNLFDTIYHEHLDYHLIKCLGLLFKRFDMFLFDCNLIKTHGGSIRIFVSKTKINISKNLKKIISYEEDFLKQFNNQIKIFNSNINNLNKKIIDILEKYKKKNKKIICYGASAKATIFINTFKISNYLDCCLDDTKIKQNKFVPGTKIMIKDPTKYKFKDNEVLLITAWNFSDEIVKKVRSKNKNIIIISPLPKLNVYS